MFVNHTTIRRKSTRRQFQASAYGSTPEFAFTHTQLQTEVNQVKASGVQEGALPQMNPRHQQSLPRCSTTSWQRECFIPYLPAPPSQLSPFFSCFFQAARFISSARSSSAQVLAVFTSSLHFPARRTQLAWLISVSFLPTLIPCTLISKLFLELAVHLVWSRAVSELGKD